MAAAGEGTFSSWAADYWRSTGSRFTYVRELLCETVEGCSAAFTPEELWARARLRDSQIALSTVYRTLGQLVEAGLLVFTSGSDGTRHYSIAEGASPAGSSHVVCLDCGKIIPVKNPCLSLREGEVAQREGFSTHKITLRYEATCNSFQETGTCARKQEG